RRVAQRRRPRCLEDWRHRVRRQHPAARTHPPAREPGSGVHGAHARQRRVPRGCPRSRGARGRRIPIMTTLPTSTLKRSVPLQPARFIDTLAAEWTKLTSLRSTYITLALGIGLSLAATPLIGMA